MKTAQLLEDVNTAKLLLKTVKRLLDKGEHVELDLRNKRSKPVQGKLVGIDLDGWPDDPQPHVLMRFRPPYDHEPPIAYSTTEEQFGSLDLVKFDGGWRLTGARV